MKTKLISFDVTKALDQGVGDRVLGITGATLDPKLELTQSGIPVSQQGIKSSAIEDLLEYFRTRERRGLGEIVAFLKESGFESFPKTILVVGKSIPIGIHVNGYPRDRSISKALLELATLMEADIRMSIISFNFSSRDLWDLSIYEYLKLFPDLEELNFFTARVHPQGYPQIAELKKLQSLDLSRTAVTDEDLMQLYRCPALKGLKLINTNVSAQAVLKIKYAILGLSVKTEW